MSQNNASASLQFGTLVSLPFPAEQQRHMIKLRSVENMNTRTRKTSLQINVLDDPVMFNRFKQMQSTVV